MGAEFVRSNRGGLITFHGPGQLVAYPILDLRQFVNLKQADKRSKRLHLLGMKWYVNTLEEVVIQTLKKGFNIEAFRSPHTGVWVQHREQEKKICAMGIHSKDLVTCHGLALNYDIDLSWYHHIVPCGIEDKGVTSLSQHLQRPVSVQDVEPHLLKQFEECFGCQIDDN